MKAIALLMFSAALTAGCRSQTAKHKPTSKAVDDSCGASMIGATGGSDGTQYKCTKGADGKGHWVEDLEAEKSIREFYAHRSMLRSALTTRVLTNVEMAEVLDIGSDIFVNPYESFRQEDVDQKYLVALKIQEELRNLHLPPTAPKH